MKMEYKLVQWYPSLPSDWEKGMLVGQGDRVGEFSDFSPCSSIYTDKRLHYKEVRTNSKFWEKVVPKEFEILKSQNYRCQGISNGGNYQVIESIKRLSDGEVFSVGDKVIYYKKRTQLKEIYYNEHNQLSFKVHGDAAPLTGVFSEKMRLRKLNDENVMLTTEDGVEMFEGDRFWYADTRTRYVNDLMVHKNFIEYIVNIRKCKTFSKKENAQAYLENNTELFSAKDIHELLKKYSRMMVDSSIYLELSKMVKERLKDE